MLTHSLGCANEPWRAIRSIERNEQPIKILGGDHRGRASSNHLLCLLGRSGNHEGGRGLTHERGGLIDAHSVPSRNPGFNALCLRGHFCDLQFLLDGAVQMYGI